MIHELKTWPKVFRATLSGKKKAEFRKDDRGFRVGHRLRLKEWNPETEQYTGAFITVFVTHIVRGPAYGIPRGYVMMSIED